MPLAWSLAKMNKSSFCLVYVILAVVEWKSKWQCTAGHICPSP